MDRAGIRSIGVQAGEVVLELAEVARRCHTSEAAVERSLGGREVRISHQPPLALALGAATSCLASAARSVSEIDAIVWLGDHPSGLRFQHELGAATAYTLFVGGYCSETVTALRIAADLIADGARAVMVASEDRFDRPYTAQAPSEKGYSDLTSDGASAVLVDAAGPLELIGYGFATRGSDWDYWVRYHDFHARGESPRGLPDPLQVFYDEVATRRIAVDRCLASAGIAIAEITDVSLPERVHPAMRSLARQLGFSPERVIRPRHGHMGRTDVAFDLAALWETPRAPGQVALAMSATIGACRCAAVRWRRRSE